MMPEPVLVSFRSQTTGTITDLLRDEGLVCAHSQDLLSYFAGALLDYKEEGVELMPSVILCNSISSLLKSIPGSVSHQIGHTPLSSEAGPRILKDCAPLSGPNWFIFIERDEDNQLLKYGVFTYNRSPTSLPIDEVIGIDANQFCILIQKSSSHAIDIQGSRGNFLTLMFSTLRTVTASTKSITEFATKCCSSISSAQHYDEFSTYFWRLLETTLTSCHGTILACADKLDIDNIPALHDAVIVSPSIDFFGTFVEYKNSNSSDSILSLQRSEELLKGFLRCDGIIIVDTKGCISAYRVFYKPAEEAGDTNEKVIGGARRRAFEGLKNLVGDHLDSVLFRSQDGQTIYYGGEK